MYEPKSVAPLPRARFARRVALHIAVVFSLIALSLGGGMTGYMTFEHLSVTDAFLNAAMLLGGMGPVDPPKTESGKVFAGLYALYAGLAFILVAGLLFTPFVHRIVHKLHFDDSK
jgi:hypothetical protein